MSIRLATSSIIFGLTLASESFAVDLIDARSVVRVPATDSATTPIPLHLAKESNGVIAIGGTRLRSAETADLEAIGGTRLRAIGGTRLRTTKDNSLAAIGGTRLRAIGGTRLRATPSNDLSAIGGTRVRAIGGTRIRSTAESSTNAIGGTRLRAIGGARLRACADSTSDLSAIGGTRVRTTVDAELSAIGGTRLRAIGGTRLRAEDSGDALRAIGGTRLRAIGGTRLRAIGGTRLRSSGESQLTAIGGTRARAIGGTRLRTNSHSGLEAIGGTRVRAIGGTRIRSVGGLEGRKAGVVVGAVDFDEIIVGPVTAIDTSSGHIEVLGQRIPVDSLPSAGQMVSVISCLTSGSREAAYVVAYDTWFVGGVTEVLVSGEVTQIFAETARFELNGGITVDYSSLLSSGSGSARLFEVGDSVLVSGVAY